MARRYWTEEELKILIEYYPKISNKELAKMIKRSESAIRDKALALGIRKTRETIQQSHKNQKYYSPPWKRWTKEEEELLKKIYATTPADELEKIFHRKRYAIAWKARKLGLEKDSGFVSSILKYRWRENPRRWTEEEINKLKDLYLNKKLKITEIAKIMGRSYNSVWTYISKLGLKRIPIVKNLKVGWIGEQLAEDFFKKKGWKVVGRPSSIAPYDFVIDRGYGREYVNAKHGKKVMITMKQIEKLAKLGKSSFLCITFDKHIYLLEINKIL